MFNKNDLKEKNKDCNLQLQLIVVGEMDSASIGTYYLPKSIGNI